MNRISATSAQRWLNRTVWGIVLATFLSDFSHEMCTAVLPSFLQSVGLAGLALGLIDGIADFFGAISKLGGGVLGHHVHHKRPWAALGYVVTSVCTAAIGLTQSLVAMVTLRTVAWSGRGFRGPLRDYLLADAVEKTHYGRAFGLERTGDMLGAVAGPMIAAAMVWFHVPFEKIILWGIVPGLLAAGSMFFLTREAKPQAEAKADLAVAQNPPSRSQPDRSTFPRLFWLVLIGVTLFGMGDFSRTFLILLAASALRDGHAVQMTASAAGQNAALVQLAFLPMLLYAMHNAVSALAAYPAGHLGDRRAKLPVLIAGYGVGVATNILLAFSSQSINWLIVVFLLSGIYYAVEETLEKAVVADLLPRRLRSLGLGYLAGGNAVGDMASSVYVGALLQSGRPQWAFGLAASLGAVGVVWMLCILPRAERVISKGADV
jgi:MFS family permease